MPLRPEEAETRLRSIATRYVDGLRPETRKALVRAGMESVSARPRIARGWFAPAFGGSLPGMAAAAAVLVMLALPAFFLRGGALLDKPQPVKDLEVRNVGGEIVVTWRDGGTPRHVVRATRKEDLTRASELRGDWVKGERWVDRSRDDSDVVYYLVE